jgi:enoyl-CoA hydratase
MNFETLKLEFDENLQPGALIAILKISRPQALNALNAQVLKDLDQCLSFLEEKENLRCVLLTGDGEKSFVAGADIKEMQNFSDVEAQKMAESGQRLFQRVEDFKVPVVALVNGFALGGGLELAMSCDFMLASEKAKVGLPEVSLGLIPGYGGTQRLSRFIGKSLARMMALTGDIYPAQKAYEWGLFVKIVAPDQLLFEGLSFAKVLAQRSPASLRLVKKSINQGFDLSQAEGMSLEAKLFAESFKTEDHKEGIQAFIEKRSPQFLGR